MNIFTQKTDVGETHHSHTIEEIRKINREAMEKIQLPKQEYVSGDGFSQYVLDKYQSLGRARLI